ncbi:hypothetical protein GCK72_017693 [Caenorhabditis remanei]|uniref:Uncharacterized protein n=2 Tax=Caenorhabditis remanei TaxID=31234 RepID=A0A6A5G9G0_CAERE|nr:hypothetical protein GCK72_017693 [Caenorhabditis remanei]KAF1751139.1 hypothetical protein GCK72_017693 [Caenorhabditis remanei]
MIISIQKSGNSDGIAGCQPEYQHTRKKKKFWKDRILPRIQKSLEVAKNIFVGNLVFIFAVLTIYMVLVLEAYRENQSYIGASEKIEETKKSFGYSTYYGLVFGVVLEVIRNSLRHFKKPPMPFYVPTIGSVMSLVLSIVTVIVGNVDDADWFKQIAIGFIYGKTIEVTLSRYTIWNGSAQAIGAYIALHFAVRMAMIIENAGFANSVQLIRITRYTMTAIALFCGYQLAAESEKLQREVFVKEDQRHRE